MGYGYDLNAIKRLIYNFQIKQSEIGEVWLHVTRQRIHQIIMDDISTGTWTGQDLNAQEMDALMFLVREGKTLYNSWDYGDGADAVFVRIIRNEDDELAIFAETNEDRKCLFDIPANLLTLLHEHAFHRLEERDFDLCKELDDSDNVVDGMFLRIRDSKLRRKYNSRVHRFHCDQDEYALRLGYGGYLHPNRASDEEIKHMLSEFLLDDGSNRIAIPIDHYRYYNFTNRASRNGLTLEEFVRKYGFEQVRFHSRQNGSRDTDRDHELLESIKHLSGSLNTTQVESKRKERSRELASKMKELYHYKCQLCNHSEGGEFIPVIEMGDGRYYVEVHHIVHLADVTAELDDESLDSYGNVIVVCCHHHKVLHYHEGGANALLYNEEVGYHFITKKGTVFKVHTNKHFIPAHAHKTYELVSR